MGIVVWVLEGLAFVSILASFVSWRLVENSALATWVVVIGAVVACPVALAAEVVALVWLARSWRSVPHGRPIVASCLGVVLLAGAVVALLRCFGAPAWG